jgi:hypothetical protein
MISRIRVEARAASMEQARREIQIVLDHARMAGWLEGVVPSSSSVTDDHYGEVYKSDRWSGYTDASGADLRFEGRMAVSFDPEVTDGGLKQYTYEVQRHELAHHDGKTGERVVDPTSWDVTNDVFVLERMNPITREHVWERNSNFGTDEQEHEVGDLALFNRAQHDVIGHLEWSVWLRGDAERTGVDLPTNVYGVISSTLVSNAPALFEYTQDILPGQTVDSVVDSVSEKVRLYAQGMVRGGQSKLTTSDA